MEHIAALMLLVGCSSDLKSCTEIPVPTPAYETVAECQTDLPLQIRLTDSKNPKVFGACKSLDAESLEQSATLEWSVDRSGRLDIEIVGSSQMLASR